MDSQYSLKPEGLVYGNAEDGSSSGIRLSGRIEVAALVRDGDSADWAKLLVWHDVDGKRHELALKMSTLLRHRAEVLSHLADGGLEIESPKLLFEWLKAETSEVRVTRVSRTGWHSGSGALYFVLPDETIGEARERVTFLDALGEAGDVQAGSLQNWTDEVAAPCAGNSRLVFALSAAFAAPLLYLLGHENGGFHLVGPSSSGKTTALQVAASVFGSGRYVQRWRATDNGLEGIAASRNDRLLVLDELAQADPRRVGEIAYMLANGQGKVRADRTGEARPRKVWRLLFLSSGETTLAQHMITGGVRVRAGQEVRFVDLPADAGADMGLFEDLHGAASPAQFAQQLSAAAARHHGVASRKFVACCIENHVGLNEKLQAEVRRIAALLLGESDVAPSQIGGQVARVADRFALAAAAGEFATDLKLTGWKKGEATLAAQKCMRAWLESRGTARNSGSPRFQCNK